MKQYLLSTVFILTVILCFAHEKTVTSYIFHSVTVVDTKSSSVKETLATRGMIIIGQYDNLKYILVSMSPDRTKDLVFRVLQTNKEQVKNYTFETYKCCAVDSIEGNNILGSGIIMLEYDSDKNPDVPYEIWYQINGEDVLLIYGGIIKVDA